MDNQVQDLRDASAPKAQLERIPNPSAEQSDAIPTAVDAWLERRLRVFERALAGLEARQEKAERELHRKIALLEERIAVFEKEGAAALQAPRAKEPPAPHAAVESTIVSDTEAPEKKAETEQLPEPQKQIGDILAHARRAAASATANILPPPIKAKNAPRWMAWAAVGCAAVTMTALALGTVAGASEPVGAMSHRQTATAFGRVIALADSGDPRDQTVLALAYLRGDPISPDRRAAERWALAGAEQGDPIAQYLVGAFYQAGDGVAADPARAFHWFEASALRGNLKAMHNLAIAYAEGQGTGKSPERAAAWFNRAALQGYKDSQFDLAVLYERGDGVNQNPGRALKWYLIAAHSGDTEAAVRATQLEQAMSPSDVAEAEREAAGFVPVAHDLIANSL